MQVNGNDFTRSCVQFNDFYPQFMLHKARDVSAILDEFVSEQGLKILEEQNIPIRHSLKRSSYVRKMKCQKV